MSKHRRNNVVFAYIELAVIVSVILFGIIQAILFLLK